MCKTQCADKHLASEASANVSSLYLAIHAIHRKRPGVAHLFGGALANDIGFLRMVEDLRWD